MITLVVNSYRVQPEQKIAPYVEMVKKFSQCRVIKDVDVYSYANLLECDALVLSGSPDLISKGVYSRGYLEFLHHITIPCLGICYGHQMLAKAFGGIVLAGKERIERDEVVRIIKYDPLFQGLPPEISVRESHQEYVSLEGLNAAGFEVLANSPSCVVEAIKHLELPIYGVQFHPERSGSVGEMIFQNFFNIVRKLKKNI
ncbi:MAG: gamma-glutamyl-gamma-aminobutyrate hydrolase family protein [candidate division WOR-3 bacterium]